MINKSAFVRRALVALALPATLTAAAVATTAPASADPSVGTPHQLVQQASDGELDWTVPAGTTTLHLHVVGGSGADGDSGAGSPGGHGGHGGLVDETIAVKPGQTVALLPGSAASPDGAEKALGDALGGRGGHGDAYGYGGHGGAATWVTLDGQVVAVAGGGGGGGGGGAVFSYGGGDGGDAGHAGSGGSGAGAGKGGSGNIAGASGIFHGEAGPDAPFGSFAGGSGGGGAGWNGASLGGGRAGEAGTYGGGGGGGAAGGLSWATDKNADFGTRTVGGDGLVMLDWATPAPSATTSTLTAPASAPQGRPVTLTETIKPALGGGPAIGGKVTFETIDINTYAKATIGTADVVNGVASLTTTSLPPGRYQGIHAIYAGDANYQGSTSDFVYPTITAPIKTVSLSPASLAFGKRTLNSLQTKDVQLTNTGSVDWSWSSASTDNADVNMPKTSCGTVKPGGTCTITISYQPYHLGPITAHITLTTTFGAVTIPVTGTGVAPAPTVTRVTPSSGSHHGGTSITVTGTNLVDVTSITVGGVKATAVSCNSATSCQATTPAGTVGTHHVRVTTATGTSPKVTADHFTDK